MPVNMKNKGLLAAAALVLVLAAAAGVGVYLFIQFQSLSQPPEETARFLPEDTSLYISMNLRPGAGQLMKAREVLDLFRKNPRFQEKLDELYEGIEEGTGIAVEEDLFPWLGPEIAVAVPTFEGIAEELELVVFIGTTDTAAAETFLRKLLAFGEESTGTEFEEKVTRGHLTFVVDTSDDFGIHIALADDYIVVATGAETLESTLARMDSAEGRERPSLFDSPGFQQARKSAESPRFGIIYVDPAGIAEFGEDVVEGLTGGLVDFGDQLPEYIVASASFIDSGIRFSTSFDYPAGDRLFVPASDNSLGSAELAPGDTLATVSFVGVRDAWDRFRDGFIDFPDLDLDEALDEVEAEIGIDIDRDIFGWMTGELAVALLLPGGVPFSTDQIHANVYVEFDDRARALSGMENIRGVLEEGGIESRVVDVGGVDATVMDLGEDGLFNLRPGYVVLEDYVVIGTTLTSLGQAVEAERGDVPSLRESPAFGRAMEAAGDATDLLVYGNVRRIVAEALDRMDEFELEEYRETAEPFVEPLEALLLGAAIEEEAVTISAVITFAAPD